MLKVSRGASVTAPKKEGSEDVGGRVEREFLLCSYYVSPLSSCSSPSLRHRGSAKSITTVGRRMMMATSTAPKKEEKERDYLWHFDIAKRRKGKLQYLHKLAEVKSLSFEELADTYFMNFSAV